MTGLDARLTKRYDELVMGHSNGLPALAFAQTQALWRFLNNDRVRPVDLVKPLLALTHEGCQNDCDDYTPALHPTGTGGFCERSHRLGGQPMTLEMCRYPMLVAGKPAHSLICTQKVGHQS